MILIPAFTFFESKSPIANYEPVGVFSLIVVLELVWLPLASVEAFLPAPLEVEEEQAWVWAAQWCAVYCQWARQPGYLSR